MKRNKPLVALRRLVIAAGLVLALPQAPASPLPQGLQPYYDTLLGEGEWGAVLNLQRLGLEALDQGQHAIAARAFDAAIARIEMVYADSPSAKKARSLWSAEGVKDFKGDAYERVMAYYYRGLLFLAEGDYGNARAAFRSAEYQDTLVNNESYSGDFGLMSLLAGWASQCAGDAGQAMEFYERAGTQQPDGLVPPARGSDTLVLVESGPSPVKVAAGSHGEALAFQSPDNPVVAASLAGENLAVLADVGWQARTLGGRQVDVILNGKASFRDGASTVGDIGLMGAQLALGNDNFDAAGAMAVVGFAAKLLSAAVKPKADIRYWDNLPDRIYGGFVTLGEQPHPAVAESLADSSRPVAAPVLDGKVGSCRVLLYRTREPASLPAQAVANLSARERQKLLRNNAQRDAAFRQEMTDLFTAGDGLALGR